MSNAIIDRLLVKQRLKMRPGFATIVGVTDKRKIKTMKGDIMEQTDRPVSNLMGVRNSIQPVMDGELIIGDWKNGLTAQQISLLIGIGIPRITPDTNIPYYSGQTFDLSDPKDVAYFNVLKEANVVAMSQDELGTGRYFFEFGTSKRKEATDILKIRRLVIKLQTSLTVSQKRQFLFIMSFKNVFPVEMRIVEMSDEDVVNEFDMAIMDDTTAKFVIESSEQNAQSIESEALLCKALEIGVLSVDMEEQVKITNNGGTNFVDFADTYEEAIKKVANQKDVKTKLLMLTAEIENITFEEKTSLIDDMYELEEEYDLSTIAFEDIKYLTTEECQSYIKSKEYKPLGSVDNFSEKDWVYAAYRAFASKLTKPDIIRYFQENATLLDSVDEKSPSLKSTTEDLHKDYVRIRKKITETNSDL